jgi:hypothetical protein
MAYTKRELKGSGDKAAPCFRPFQIGKLSDRCLPIQTLLYNTFKQILINLASFMAAPKSVRIFYNTSLQTELQAFLIKLERKILDNISYKVDSSDIPQ